MLRKDASGTGMDRHKLRMGLSGGKAMDAEYSGAVHRETGSVAVTILKYPGDSVSLTSKSLWPCFRGHPFTVRRKLIPPFVISVFHVHLLSNSNKLYIQPIHNSSGTSILASHMSS